MCGIVGYVGKKNAAPFLLDGLSRLEYRGYDSSGLTTYHNGRFHRQRTLGKLDALARALADNPVPGTIGIGHTRWATHGEPSLENAHPHQGQHVSLVHNGIVENATPLRQELEKQGVIFTSQTDTEVIVHLLDQAISIGLPPRQALTHVMKQLKGAWGIGVLFLQDFNRLYCVRQGSPLVIGLGSEASFLGSDAIALSPWCQRFIYLEEGDVACIEATRLSIWAGGENPVVRPVEHTVLQGAVATKGDFSHFMEKEMYEQPAVIAKTIAQFQDLFSRKTENGSVVHRQSISRLILIGCGTAFYAGLTAKYWIEGLAQLPVDVDIASEFRYRQGPIDPDGLYLFISQSGETADTLAALRYVTERGGRTACLVNVRSSTLDRSVETSFYTDAGTEIGVASTKAFTTQLIALYCLALEWGQAHGSISAEDAQKKWNDLSALPAYMTASIQRVAEKFGSFSKALSQANNVLFVGRHLLYPIALEGALKLKELSYIHAEGYGAGELKHGPLALIDADMPTVALISSTYLLDKTLSNLAEIKARGGPLFLIGDAAALEKAAHLSNNCLELPILSEDLSLFSHVIGVQFLAFGVALEKGADIDQPRNLAKSVTVE